MIYTSYFASKKYDPEKAINISRWPPKYYKGRSFPYLYPPADLLWSYKNGYVDNVEYERQYRENVLAKLEPAHIAEVLDGEVLLCYEKSGDFCHRNIVAAWLREAGFECEEL